MVFTSNSSWKPKNVNFFQKVGNQRNWILFVPRVSVRLEKKSPWLCQYQSYISNWYVNGKAFASTTTWEPKIRFFFKKVRNWIWLVLKSWNQHSSRSHLYVDIGDASLSLWGSTSSYWYNAGLCVLLQYKILKTMGTLLVYAKSELRFIC